MGTVMSAALSWQMRRRDGGAESSMEALVAVMAASPSPRPSSSAPLPPDGPRAASGCASSARAAVAVPRAVPPAVSAAEEALF